WFAPVEEKKNTPHTHTTSATCSVVPRGRFGVSAIERPSSLHFSRKVKSSPGLTTDPYPAALHKMSIPTPAGQLDGALAAPKYGTLIPNRVFVGGISGDTTEAELCRLFSSYGNVKSTKIIVDRAGVSKGYGFVTFETEHEAQKLQNDCDCIVLRDRKLNIAPAIKKQTLCATNGAVYYAATPPTPAINNIPIEQFATVYPPGVPTMYPPTLPYQPFYQYYSVPMNVPTIWPQNYQGE
uniref:Uncharacterized protein n=1 Tax=Anopheles stephensi TaxID=30069 RepID=A0A182Y0X7_ANOST